MMPARLSVLWALGFVSIAGWACYSDRSALLPDGEGAKAAPYTDQEQAALGRQLFGDARLSRDSTLSCATCHQPTRAFTEPRPVSHGLGARARKRNTPTLINILLGAQSLDWDGRASDLAEQLQGVFSVDGDMGMDLGEAVRRVRDDSCYRTVFRRAYGREPDAVSLVTSFESFLKSLVVADSRFDRFYLGGQATALDEQERLGWELFRTARAGCAGCHVPVPDPVSGVVLFVDSRFHNLGIGYELGWTADVGRYSVTQRQRDWGAFRTPTLRNVSLTAPYMHDGSIATLEEVIDLYNQGGRENPHLDEVIRGPRHLSRAEAATLVAFLKALTAEWLPDSAEVSRRLLMPRPADPTCR